MASYFVPRAAQRLRSVQASVSTFLAPIQASQGKASGIRTKAIHRRVAWLCGSGAGWRRRRLDARDRIVRARGPPDHFFGSRAMGIQKKCKKEGCVQARGAKYLGLDLLYTPSRQRGFSRVSLYSFEKI